MAAIAASTSRLRGIVALAASVAALCLAIWIVIPGPTYFFLRLSVGAPEVSAWLIVVSAIAAVLSLLDARERAGSRLALVASLAALALSAIPLASFRTTSRHFDAAMDSALGSGFMQRLVRPNGVPYLRPRPLVIADLFRGVDVGAARITRGVPVADPGGLPLTVDIYQPETAGGPYPIVVQVYGGAWQRGAPGSNPKAAQWLAAHGYVVFAIDYRHAPRSRWPAQLEDVQTALAWIKGHAVSYEADTTRVALIGRSAGAHLAMMAGYSAGPLSVRAVVSYYGPVDLVDAYQHPPHPDPLRIRAVQDTLFGGTLDQMPDRYRDASPIQHTAEKRPATLLVYAARDHIVERRYGRQMYQRLTNTHTTAVYLEIPWADHAFDEVFNGPSNQLALYHTERFLAWALDAGSR